MVNEKMEKYKMVYIYSYMYIVCMKKTNVLRNVWLYLCIALLNSKLFLKEIYA